MSEHLGKIVVMVAMTHGFRTLGRMSNPRWAGLALGLPCTSAVALIGGGLDRGDDYAVAMSSNSLIGLAGAVALPMAYAGATRLGWRLPWGILGGIATYLAIAILAGKLLPTDGSLSFFAATLAVLAAIWLANRIPREERSPRPLRLRSARLVPALRILVPSACLLGSLTMGETFGPSVAGLMSTFPGMTLTVLILTHLESGASSGLQMARSLPVGNLAMVAFLATFRLGCPTIGLMGGMALGYVAALAMLALILSAGRLRRWVISEFQAWVVVVGLLAERHREAEAIGQQPWPKAGRRFSPLIELIAA